MGVFLPNWENIFPSWKKKRNLANLHFLQPLTPHTYIHVREANGILFSERRFI